MEAGLSAPAKCAPLALGALALASRYAERRILRAVSETANPPGWSTPRFPAGHDIAVPTSDGAVLSVSIAGPERGPTAGGCRWGRR